MLNNLTTKLALYLLRKKNLSEPNKAKILSALLQNIGALPLRKTITFDNDGTIVINGKKLNPEQAIHFKESAMAYKDSFARQLIHEQLRFLAIEMGVHQGLSLERIRFSQAALWILEEEKKLLQFLSPD